MRAVLVCGSVAHMVLHDNATHSTVCFCCFALWRYGIIGHMILHDNATRCSLCMLFWFAQGGG